MCNYVYVINLHYENRDEFEIIDENRYAKTYEKAKEIFNGIKKTELEYSWLAEKDFNELDFFEDSEDCFVADDLGSSNLYEEISIKKMVVEE